MCVTPTLHTGVGKTHSRDWSESLATHRAVKTVNLWCLSMWHSGDWFSVRGLRRREPFTCWQPNKRLAEALCPLTSSLKADCVATQLCHSDSQTAGLVIINPSAQRWSPNGQAHLHKPSCWESTFFWLHRPYFLCVNFSFIENWNNNFYCCVHILFFRFLLCKEGRMCEIQIYTE